jgi:hypothetical protein
MAGESGQAGSGGKGGAGGSGGAGTAGAGGGAGTTGGSGGMSPPDASGGSPGADAGEAPDVAAPKLDRPPTPTGPGKIVLVAGGGNGGDGSQATMARLQSPFGAVTDPVTGDLYIAEVGGGGRIRKVDDKGIITTVMGAGATGPGAKISLNQPHNLLFQPHTRNLFVGDTMAERVIKMDAATGESVVFAGSGSNVASGLGRSYCLGFDAAGKKLYVTGGGVTIIDLETMAVSKINTATPRVLAVDSKSNVYLGGGASLRMANPAGMISDVMGSGGLNGPKHLSVDLDDNVIITDTESDTIRKYVIATRTVVKIAGTGGNGAGTLGGSPELAGLGRPHGAYVDAQGRIFIADSFNQRVLRIEY